MAGPIGTIGALPCINHPRTMRNLFFALSIIFLIAAIGILIIGDAKDNNANKKVSSSLGLTSLALAAIAVALDEKIRRLIGPLFRTHSGFPPI